MNIINRNEQINSTFSNWIDSSEEPFKNIFITKEKTKIHFQREVKEVLERIESNAIGKRLLEKVQRFSCQIFIVSDEKNQAVHFTKSTTIITCNMKDSEVTDVLGNPILMPIHVTLFHELVHAYHNVSGKRACSHILDPFVWDSDEEYKTIMGFPSKKKIRVKAKVTENAFRKIEGLPERFSHLVSNGQFNKMKMCKIRAELLGKVHLRNLSQIPDSLSPPPVAMLSEEDLGAENRSVVYCEIKYINDDLKLNIKYPNHYYIYMDIYMEEVGKRLGNRSYDFCTEDLSSEKVKNFFTDFVPSLKDVQFNILSMVFARLSKLEQEALKDS